MCNLLKNIKTSEVTSCSSTRILLMKRAHTITFFLFPAMLNLLLGDFPPHLGYDEKKK